jgi:hypothetical protein
MSGLDKMSMVSAEGMPSASNIKGISWLTPANAPTDAKVLLRPLAHLHAPTPDRAAHRAKIDRGARLVGGGNSTRAALKAVGLPLSARPARPAAATRSASRSGAFPNPNGRLTNRIPATLNGPEAQISERRKRPKRWVPGLWMSWAERSWPAMPRREPERQAISRSALSTAREE